MKMIIMGLLSLTMAMRQDAEPEPIKKSYTELLIQKNWVLSNMGYDRNSDNVIDPMEDALTDCRRDDLYIFSPDGSAAYFDSGLICGNGVTETLFSWRWIKEGKMLVIGKKQVEVINLSESEFSFYVETMTPDGELLKFISTLRH
jgi:hypothetical protein